MVMAEEEEKRTGGAWFLSGIRRGLSERLKPIIETEAIKLGLVPLGISDAPVTLDTSRRTA